MPLELPQHERVALGIGQPLATVAGGEHPPVEGVHLDPGVVGQRQEPGRHGDRARLAQSVVGIGRFPLGGQDDAGKLGEVLDAIGQVG